MEQTWIKDANGNKCSVEYWGIIYLTPETG